MVSVHSACELAIVINFATPAVVLAWTIICLAIAAHFQSLLVITDLSVCAHFVQ